MTCTYEYINNWLKANLSEERYEHSLGTAECARELAEKFGCDQSSLKTIHAQFGRIGGQWVSCAGTSTGPIVGLALSLGVVVVAYGLKKRRKIM